MISAKNNTTIGSAWVKEYRAYSHTGHPHTSQPHSNESSVWYTNENDTLKVNIQYNSYK